MTDPKVELVDLGIEEGSLVGDGDNPEAHVKLFKDRARGGDGQEGPPMKKTFWRKLADWAGSAGPKTTAEILKDNSPLVVVKAALIKSVDELFDVLPDALDGDWLDKQSAHLAQSVKEYGEEAAPLTKELAKTHPEIARALTSALDRMTKAVSIREIADGKTQKIDRDAFATAMADLEKIEIPSAETNSEDNVDKTALKKVLAKMTPDQRKLLFGKGDHEEEALEEAAQALTEAAVAVDAAAAEVSDDDDPNKGDDEDKDTDKGDHEDDDEDDDAMKAKKAKKAKAAEVEKAVELATKKLNDRIFKLEDEKADAEFLAKAKEIVGEGTAGVDLKEFSKMLKNAPDEEARKGLTTMVQGLIAQAEKNSEIGKSRGSSRSESAPNSAEDRLQKKADEIFTKSTDGDFTEADAYVKAMKLNPKLAEEATLG